MKIKSLLLLSLCLMASIASASTFTLYFHFDRSNDGQTWEPMGTYGLKRVTSEDTTRFYRTYLTKDQDQSTAPEGYTAYSITIQSSATSNGSFTNLYMFHNILLDASTNQQVKTTLSLEKFN